MHFHILMYNLSCCGMEVLDSGNKAYYIVQPFGTVSQYGIFKGKCFAQMIIAER